MSGDGARQVDAIGWALPGGWRRAADGLAGTHPRLSVSLRALDQAVGAEPCALAMAQLAAHMQLVVADPPGSRARIEALPPSDQARLIVRVMAGAAASRSNALVEACALLDAAAAEARRRAVEPLLAWAQAERGRAHAVAGDGVLGLACLSEAAALSHRLGMTLLEVTALTNLGIVHAQANEAEAYARHTRAALAISRRIEDPQGLAHGLCNLGGALIELGEVDEAARCYAEALPLAEASGWRYVHALAQAGLGAVHYARGDLAAGRAAYAASEGALQALDQPYQVVRQALLEAGYLSEARRYEAALERCAVGLLVAQEGGLSWLVAQAQEQRAGCLMALGDAPGAVAALQDCVGRLRSDADTRIAKAEARSRGASEALAAFKRAQDDRARSVELEAQRAALQAALQAQRRLRAELERTLREDALTGIGNRRVLEEKLTWAVQTAIRVPRPLSLLMLDLDHFKAINDTWGHSVGDEVLVAVAARLAGRVRVSDVLVRWGGEEFCVLLPDTDATGARRLADDLLAVVRAQPVLSSAGPIALTVSVGIAVAPPVALDADGVFRAADSAVFAAKRAGRDQAVLWAGPEAAEGSAGEPG